MRSRLLSLTFLQDLGLERQEDAPRLKRAMATCISFSLSGTADANGPHEGASSAHCHGAGSKVTGGARRRRQRHPAPSTHTDSGFGGSPGPMQMRPRVGHALPLIGRRVSLAPPPPRSRPPPRVQPRPLPPRTARPQRSATRAGTQRSFRAPSPATPAHIGADSSDLTRFPTTAYRKGPMAKALPRPEEPFPAGVFISVRPAVAARSLHAVLPDLRIADRLSEILHTSPIFCVSGS